MKRAVLALVAVFLLIYVLPLGVRPMVIPDETRYAEIPREMIASGDWVVPRLAGIRYFEKPVLGYWLGVLSMKVFGENAFAARLPQALSAGFVALMLFVLARRYGGSRVGLLAAAIFLTCMLVFALGVFCVLDSPLSLFLTGAMICFFFAHSSASRRAKTGFLIVCGVFCGLAFLTKGFLAFVVPVVSIVPFLLWERRWKSLLLTPWLPALAVLLVAAPWCLLIASRESDFWHQFFWVEHVVRFLKPGPPQHPEPFWYFVPILIAGAMPWSLLLPAAARGFRKADLGDSLTRFAICWLVFPFLFFSASEGKLGTYILPCFPPLVVLMAKGLHGYFANNGRRLFKAGALLGAVFATLTAIALVVSELTGIFPLRLYGAGETHMWIAVLAAIAAWVLLDLLAARVAGSGRALALFCVAPVLFMFVSHFVWSRWLQEAKAPGHLLRKNAGRVTADTIIVSDDYVGPAVCWYYKRTDILLLGGGGELQYGIRNYPDSGQRLLPTVEQFRDLTESARKNKKRVVLISDAGRYKKYSHIMLRPVFEDLSEGFAFVEF